MRTREGRRARGRRRVPEEKNDAAGEKGASEVDGARARKGVTSPPRPSERVVMIASTPQKSPSTGASSRIEKPSRLFWASANLEEFGRCVRASHCYGGSRTASRDELQKLGTDRLASQIK